MTIDALVNKYTANRDSYRNHSYNETLLRSDFLDPLFELLGWDIRNSSGRPTNEREVVLEESLKAEAHQYAKKPDYTFRLFSDRKFFLEAKKPSVHIETSDEPAKQIRRYGFTAKLKISALSNFEYLIIYDTSVIVKPEDTVNTAIVKKYHYTQYVDKFEEITELIGKESVYSGIYDEKWKDIEDKIDLCSVDTLFLSQINSWRLLLGAEIYKCDNSITEQHLNDAVQSYINRIIFLRVCEDRNIESYHALLNLTGREEYSLLTEKFRLADKKYNSGLFDQLLTDQIISDVGSAFWIIIHQLYYPESPYSFSVFSSDILGRIYEIFLSEKLEIIDNAVVLTRKPEHVDRDVVTTPTYIIQSILKETLVKKCIDSKPEEILKMRIADISCGSGAFLLELFQYLNDVLIDYYLANDRSKLVSIAIDSYKLCFDIKRDILLSCIYGIDKDYNAVEATKFGLLLKLLENEDCGSISKVTPVLPDLSDNLFYGNTLIDSSFVKTEEEKGIVNPFDFDGMRFDVIIGNPPYMKSEDMNNITRLEMPIYKRCYTSAYKQFDKYFLFIEKGLDLLTDNGILGYIVPSKFTKVGAGTKLRELLVANGNLLSITSFGANQIFEDKTTYTCLLTISKESSESFSFTEIKDLEGWKNRYTENIITNIQTNTLNANGWVLVPHELVPAYNDILSQSIPLSEIVGGDGIFNGIQTSANDVFVFIPDRCDDTCYYFSKNDTMYKVEKGVTRPYFQTSRGDDNLYTYRTFAPNARVIYPYEIENNKAILIALDAIESNYPNLYEYLTDHKERLERRDIKPTPSTDNEWYRYGRHQSLDSCSVAEKIIVGVLSAGDKYAIDTNGTLVSSGGTAGYCIIANKIGNYSTHYLQAILNSKYLEWICALYGEVFRGGYIARGTKVLEKLPIRAIDFTNQADVALHNRIVDKQKQLIQIHDKIDENQSNPRRLTVLKRDFARAKREQELLLLELYNLEENDIMIPSIKEIYGTN